MLPQRLATWLSATRKQPSGSACDQFGDGAPVEDAVAEIAEHDASVGMSATAPVISSRIVVGDRAVVERVDLQQAIAADDDGILVGRRPRPVDRPRRTSTPAVLRSSSTNSP